jgi:hypothetical protein
MATTSAFGWETPDDTDLVKDGAAAIRTLGNSIDTSMADLKGGSTFQILAKNSNTDMDFVWVDDQQGDITAVTAGTGITGGGTTGAVTVSFDQANFGGGQFAAGKNKIINGDFGIWQRGTSFSSMGFGAYTADRFQNAQANTLAVTASQQSFTAGAAPVAGYESAFFHRTVVPANSGSGDYAQLSQKIEDVRDYAGQQVTLSFWAKAASGTPKIAIELTQNFGTGGSPSSAVDTYITQVTTSTSWARYTATFTVPSISGKTVGTTANTSFLQVQLWYSAGSSLNARTGSLGNQANTFDIWGVQLEAGSVATPFQTASGGSPQAELAMCQRYYEKSYQLTTAPGTADQTGSYGLCVGTNTVAANYFTYAPVLKVTKRTTPTITLYDFAGNSGKVTKVSAVDLSLTDNQTATADRIGESGFRIYSALGTAGGFYGHYVASAEL